MNVVIYARYSSHNQNDQTVEGQIAECKFKYIKGSKLYAYCNKHGLWSCDVE